MGRFTTHDEAEQFIEQNCKRCRHYSETDPCAVWQAHIFLDLEPAAQPVLDCLITRPIGRPQVCRMFYLDAQMELPI